MRRFRSNEHSFEGIVVELNAQLSLPFDILISFEDCDEPDAFYDSEPPQVTICYQLVEDFYYLFSRKVKNKAKLDAAIRGATASAFIHELGHLLADAWQLPITGKEEDAVDQLSTLILINRTQNGEQMALDGARSFKLYADMEKGAEKFYWDEHSLDEQRFYDTICLIYGRDTERYAYFVKNGTLPLERAEICPDEYAKVQNVKKSPQTSSR